MFLQGIAVSMFKLKSICPLVLFWLIFAVPPAGVFAADDAKELRIGMIGLDTSHCLAFTKILNTPDDPKHIPGCRVVLVYPKGSPDIESSVSRVPKYTEDIKKMGVEIATDLEAMVAQVDAVLLETNDGRPHLEQIIPVLKAGKPCFIDKPIAGSLTDSIVVFKLAEHYKVPVFSSSSLRFGTSTQAVRNGSIGEVTGCDTFSPCALEATHPDLFWYGIHGVESLFTVMGAGVQTVVRTNTNDFEQVTATWADGRIGTFRGIRTGKGGYGGTAFGTKGVAPVGAYDGYAPLVVEIVKFFKDGNPPVSHAETTDIYAFMEAADESKRQGFSTVNVADVIAKATAEAETKFAAIIAE